MMCSVSPYGGGRGDKTPTASSICSQGAPNSSNEKLRRRMGYQGVVEDRRAGRAEPQCERSVGRVDVNVQVVMPDAAIARGTRTSSTRS